MFTLNGLLFGQYQRLDTPIHRLDPRVKLLWAIAVMAIMAFTLDPCVYGGMTLYLVVLVIVARLPRASLLPALRSFLLLFAITFALHVVFAPSGGRVYFTIAGVSVSSIGVYNGFLYSYRIVLFLITAMLVNLTASPVDITDGITRLIRPLRAIGVPVGEITAMIFIALRFIPVLSDEARTIRAAQLSRGLKPGGRFPGRIRSALPIVLPLFLGSIRRAEQLALAIESRGYRRGIVRTSLSSRVVGRNDIAFIAISAAVLIGILFLARMARP